MAAPSAAFSCTLLACCLAFVAAVHSTGHVAHSHMQGRQLSQNGVSSHRALSQLASSGRRQRLHLEVSESIRDDAGLEGKAAGPGAYLAMCLVVKDQNDDLREWIEYHMYLGAGKFYIFDDNSTSPANQGIMDLVEAGIVHFEFVGPYGHPTKRLQLHVYDTCIQRYRAQHQWIAFVDTDEFFVLTDPHMASLPDLLQEYEEFGGLAVNWQMFGSSGHLTRPEGSTLAAYVACYPLHHPENHHVKTIANMAYVDCVGGDPHHFTYLGGKHAVSTAREVVDGAKSLVVRSERVILHHYVTKSLAQYAGKMGRGSAMGNRKSMEFFNLVQQEATQNCTSALHLGQ